MNARTLRITFAVLALAAATATTAQFHVASNGNDADKIAPRIQRGESFLTNLFDPQLRLLSEYRGRSTYWLLHDNYLAAHLLARNRPDLSREMVFGEADEALPFRTYVLTNVASLDGRKIRTELLTTNILSGWDEYADLLLLASLAQARSAEAEARRNFERAVAIWDGQGFADRAAKHNGLYATYKLARRSLRPTRCS